MAMLAANHRITFGPSEMEFPMLLSWWRRWQNQNHRPFRAAGSGTSACRLRTRLGAEGLEDRCLPAVTNFMVLGADAGGGPHVRVLDGNGQEKFSFMAYDPSFLGGVHVATGDVEGTGVDDIVTAPGAGGGPDIRVFNGATGALVREFMAFDPTVTCGLSVAVGDVNGDGYADIIVGAGAGGGPHVEVFSGKDGSLLQSFMAYSTSFFGGVNVAAGDVNGDGRADIIVGPGAGGGPNVKVFSGADGSLLQSFMAYDPAFTGGVNVGGGDLDGTGFADVITGAGAGGGPHVKAFAGPAAQEVRSFMAYDPAFTGGVSVCGGFLQNDLTADIFTAAGPGGNAQVHIFSGKTLQQVETLTAYDNNFNGGVSINGPCIQDADTVITWNRVLLQTINTKGTQPPQASRAMGMVQAAVYDAVNAIDQTHQVYHAHVTAPAGASMDAAAAADRVLASLFPDQVGRFNAVLAASLAIVPDGQSKTDGVTVGQSVADNILAWRSTDGADKVVNYVPGNGPGVWVPTPPGYLPALDPQWPYVTPFAMTSGSQFRPAGPPALTSDAYTAAFNEVKNYGSINSTTRTADQTQIAYFWADSPGQTATPPGHWNEIAQRVSLLQGLSLVQNARLLALLDIAEADAAIAAWDAKYTYNFWRPITAIQNADTDGNPNDIKDPNWTPLLVTPPFPSYTSGHSTFSGAADAVLSSFFGSNFAFTVGSDGLPNVTRSFASFAQAANEAGQSRIYGGIHYQFDNQDGLTAGRSLGPYVVNNFLGSV
jgi:membrane-associated phospholipid phosphatase